MRILFLLCAVVATLGKKSRNEDALNDNDPREDYFRYMRAYNGEEERPVKVSADVPKPGGFRIYYPDNKRRLRRDVEEEELETTTVVNVEGDNPLELENLEISNFTDSGDVEVTNELVINDFIRFKREAEETTEDASNSRLKRQEERSGKMLMSTGGEFPEGDRQPRGATKDQWIKQPYPVETTNPHRNYDDNVQSVSEMTRVPRVHFVTQRRSESAPPLIYHSYDRESRSRDLSRQVSRDLDRDLNRDMDRRYYPNQPIYYEPQNYQHRPYSYYEGDRRQDYDQDRYYDDEPPKQKRIIYFATLPEVVRTPPNVENRYNYRNRDYRYVTSPEVSVGSGPNYRYRNYNPYPKSRYDEGNKESYPTKVSTDVNVREVKKNPERRIYSEADKRFDYKVPNYHHDRDYSRDKSI